MSDSMNATSQTKTATTQIDSAINSFAPAKTKAARGSSRSKQANTDLKFTNKPITASSIKKLRTQCLILPVYDEKSLPTLTRTIDAATGGQIKQLLKTGDFQGKADQTALIPCEPLKGIERIILFGCGKKSEFNASALQSSINQAIKTLSNTKATQAAIAVSDIDTPDAYRIISQTIISNLYKFSQLKSDLSKEKHRLKSIALLGAGTAKQREKAKQSLDEGTAIGNGMNYTRTLGNLPGNICTPSYLAKEAAKLARKNSKLSCKALSEKDLEKLKAGAFLSVSKGSDEPAKMIIMDYKGSPKKSDAPYVFVGKGITFDTGGICIKPSSKMDEMKYDMCGAASVFGLMHAVTALKLPINVIGIIAAAENMPSARATRPGDIVTSMSGKTIEILNTDAEGRLVLCDALTYAKRYKPAAVIDIATLTGACIVALGNTTSGLMSNHDGLAKQLLKAGEIALDPAWQLPINKEYTKMLDSEFADFANIGSGGAGTITAACFLSHFTKEYNWAHLDIAGTAWKSGGGKGATGRPVPLLTQYLLNRVKKGQ